MYYFSGFKFLISIIIVESYISFDSIVYYYYYLNKILKQIKFANFLLMRVFISDQKHTKQMSLCCIFGDQKFYRVFQDLLNSTVVRIISTQYTFLQKFLQLVPMKTACNAGGGFDPQIIFPTVAIE